MKFGLFITGLLFSVCVFAQSENQSFSSEKKTELKKSSKVEASTQRQVRSNSVKDNSDGYMGMKERILKKLTVDVLPSDCPKYKEGTPAEQYKLDVKNWMKKNKHLVTEEFKQKHKARKAQK